jgi:hypothetical protein
MPKQFLKGNRPQGIITHCFAGLFDLFYKFGILAHIIVKTSSGKPQVNPEGR